MLIPDDILRQWPHGSFDAALKHLLESLPSGSLPLEHGITRCGIIDDSQISVCVIRSSQTGNAIQARVGVFFTEIAAGCVCGEDPTVENAYCELVIDIDQNTGDAIIQPLPG